MGGELKLFQTSSMAQFKDQFSKLLKVPRAQVTSDKSDNLKASFVSVSKIYQVLNNQSKEENLIKLLNPNIQMCWQMKKFLKQTIQKMSVTMPK